MFSANNLRSCLWLVSLCVVLGFGLTGCGEDAPSWAGTWSLQTVDGQDWRALLLIFGATVEDKWTFHDDGTWEIEMTVTVLGEKETTQSSGTYTITDTTFSISSPDPEFSLDMDISIDDSLDSEQSSEPKEETGTWVKDGNTLTLTLSDGQALVFKKL